MRINAIDTDAENREVVLRCSDGDYTVMQSDFETLCVSEGDEADDELIAKLEHFDSKLRCVKQAFSYLSYADCSSKRLAMKLGRKFDRECVDKTIALLTEFRYLNDESLCLDYARNCYEVKRHGPIRIKNDLFSLGFTQADIANAVACYEDIDHSENMLYLLGKKYPSHNKEDTNKAFSYLYRQGYAYDDVKAALNSYFDSEI